MYDKLHSQILCIIFVTKLDIALQFNLVKMGDDEIARIGREKLDQRLNELQTEIIQAFDFFNHSTEFYNDEMQTSLNEVEYFNPEEFLRAHIKTRNTAIVQV